MASRAAKRVPSLVAGSFTEPQFVEAIENCSFLGEHFHHIEHLRLAWIYLQTMDVDSAAARMAESILRFATFHHSPEKYNRTLTDAWVRLVAAARRRSPGSTFPSFLEANAELLDSKLPFQYFTKELLNSAKARSECVAPDLAPLS